jgi:tetratricopeptide (TPR) repeat protein
LARARHLQPDFFLRDDEAGPLAEICRMVEGMPLALELTAAWVDTLSPAGIVANLQESLALFESDLVDLPQRHRSLRTVWGSTWQRLTPAEQEIFAWLSLFRGGFTQEAAAAVAGATLPILAGLTRKYLVTLARKEGRYTIHELLRQYSEEQLEAAGQLAGGCQRHYEYYLDLAVTAETHLHGPEQAAWLDRLDSEQDNLRRALEWGLQRPENTESFARLIYATSWHWRIRSQVTEGSSWIGRALDREDGLPGAQALLLYVAGHMAWMRGEFAGARQHHATSLALWQEIDGGSGRVANLALHGLGMAAHMQEDAAGALPWFLESLACFQALDDDWGIAFTQGWLASVYYALGDQEAADVAIEQSLAISRRLGDNWLLNLFISHSAYMAWTMGDLVRAKSLAEEAGELGQATGHTHSLGQILVLRGQIAVRQGEPEEARRYFSEALIMFEEMGHRDYAAEVEALLEDIP